MDRLKVGGQGKGQGQEQGHGQGQGKTGVRSFHLTGRVEGFP